MRLLRLRLVNYIGIYHGMGLNTIDIDFSKCKNKLLVIKGDNGTGKSTMYKAMHPLNDNTIEFIPKMEASKLISYILDDGTVLTITYISSVSSKEDRKPSKCSIIRSYPNGQSIELNPSGNINTGKDIIYEMFDLDDNFILLSQLSASRKGLGSLKPGDRKKYVNAIIDSLVAYSDMYKLFSKKSAILKSMLSSLSTKISQIGNVEALSDVIERNQKELNELEQKKNMLISSTATIKAKLNELSKDGDIIEIYKESVEKKKKLESSFSNLPPIQDYSEEELLQYEKESSKLEANQEFIEARLNEIITKEHDIRNELDQSTIKLNSLFDKEILDDTKKRISLLEEQLTFYVNSFNSIGFKEYENITEQEYSLAIDALEKFNNSILVIGDKYDYSVREEAIKYINKDYVIQDTDRLLQSLQNRLNDLCDKINKQESLRRDSIDYDNIPRDCNHMDDCPFIRTIVLARKSMLSDEEFNRLIGLRDDLITTIQETKIAIEKQNNLLACIAEIRYIYQYITSMYGIIKKFPNTERLSSIKEISHHINSVLPININISRYREYTNYITAISAIKEDLSSLQSKLDKILSASKTSIVLQNTIEKLSAELKDISNSKLTLLGQLSDVKNRKLQISSTLDTMRYAKINKLQYDEIFTELKETTELVEKLSASNYQYHTLSDELMKQNMSLNTISMNDIPTLTNQIEQNKYRMVLFGQYKKDYKEYESIYEKLQSLRHYTSINGIQTIYMSVFMNSILQTTNDLLQLLFSGIFTLQPFIINENEFRIPCIDVNGNVREDISFMSDSQLSMISMIISFALLHKASSIYNIIKLDEVDNNLDNVNRLQFSVLINQIMNVLNFHQCVIISHNNELDLSNTDMILFKIENKEVLQSLYNSGANIIFSYGN